MIAVETIPHTEHIMLRANEIALCHTVKTFSRKHFGLHNGRPQATRVETVGVWTWNQTKHEPGTEGMVSGTGRGGCGTLCELRDGCDECQRALCELRDGVPFVSYETGVMNVSVPFVSYETGVMNVSVHFVSYETAVMNVSCMSKKI
ncbi:hypothetical protein Btru_011638 [Bulinus truncatus]|nr:hypothetical protein Btru_011638 [Bulinus truncatus]